MLRKKEDGEKKIGMVEVIECRKVLKKRVVYRKRENENWRETDRTGKSKKNKVERSEWKAKKMKTRVKDKTYR